MLRLKANKTSLYKLVSEYMKLPPARTAEFIKVYRSPSFWLKWWEGNNPAQAYFSTCAGKAMLSVTVRDIETGNEISHQVYVLGLKHLSDMGMVERATTAAERKRVDRAADQSGLAPAT